VVIVKAGLCTLRNTYSIAAYKRVARYVNKHDGHQDFDSLRVLYVGVLGQSFPKYARNFSEIHIFRNNIRQLVYNAISRPLIIHQRQP
jgi:hypothetical protein